MLLFLIFFVFGFDVLGRLQAALFISCYSLPIRAVPSRAGPFLANPSKPGLSCYSNP